MLTFIQEGRANLLRLLWEYARRSGAYVARDVESRWGLEYGRLAKIFPFNVSDKGTGSSSGTLNDLIYVANAEGRRLQPGDILNFMGFWVKQDATTGRTMAAASGAGVRAKTSVYSMPEQVKVIANYGDDSAATGACTIKVRRNHGGTAPTGHADLDVDFTSPSPVYVTEVGTPFLWKAGNSLPEGSDDQWTYTDVDEYDYNYCQYVMRKWSASETEQNVDRFFTREKTFQRNARKALDEFTRELDMIITFGSRKTETENGRRKWYTGGILEFIPDSNKVPYDDSLFQTKNFNNKLKDMFYYGSQTKFVLAGADFYTNFSNMIDNKIIIPSTAVNGWGVELTRFSATNGGTLLFAPSDTLSLHGMSDYAIVIDPAHFQYGHLQNMDIKTIKVETVNPHVMEGEIYGQITLKRTNPKAHWLFMKATS